MVFSVSNVLIIYVVVYVLGALVHVIVGKEKEKKMQIIWRGTLNY